MCTLRFKNEGSRNLLLSGSLPRSQLPKSFQLPLDHLQPALWSSNCKLIQNGWEGREEGNQPILLPDQIYGKGFGEGHTIRVRYLGLSMDYSTP